MDTLLCTEKQTDTDYRADYREGRETRRAGTDRQRCGSHACRTLPNMEYIPRKNAEPSAEAVHPAEKPLMSHAQRDPVSAQARGNFSRLLAELHHSRAARIRVAGGGAGGDAPDAQASVLGLPYGQPQPPKRLSPSWDTTNHGGVQREVSIFLIDFSDPPEHLRYRLASWPSGPVPSSAACPRCARWNHPSRRRAGCRRG